MIRPQADFPMMEVYKEHFPIDKHTVFALGQDIYTDYPLSPDLMIHELVHIKQQLEVGVKEWVYDFLYVPSKRLEYEVEAYREQIKSIKDRNHKMRVYLDSARKISSPLYGNMITHEEAKKLLKV
jgi:hypothetical protein